MGFNAKYKKKKPAFRIRRKKNASKRKMVPSSLSTYNKYMVHSYMRYEGTARSITVVNPNAEQSASHVFRLDSLPGFTEYANLYDQYQITGVKAYIQLVGNPDASTVTNGTGANLSNWYPKLWWCFDRDDEGLENISSMKERYGSKCRVLRPNSLLKVYMKPSVLNTAYVAAAGTGYHPSTDTWIDCGNTSVKHYGIKYVVDTLGIVVQNGITVRIEYKYYLKFRQPR